MTSPCTEVSVSRTRRSGGRPMRSLASSKCSSATGIPGNRISNSQSHCNPPVGSTRPWFTASARWNCGRKAPKACSIWVRSALQKGDVAGAEAIFRRLVERNPMDATRGRTSACAFTTRIASPRRSSPRGRPRRSLCRRVSTSRCSPRLRRINVICGEPVAALETLERNLARFPDPSAHYLYGQLLLKTGRLPEGWDQHEFRWLHSQFASDRAHANRPVWSGQDLKGKCLLLVPDQGFGDFFQCIRYAPCVRAQGATVWLHSPAELDAIARCCAGIDRIIGARETVPEFDFHISADEPPARLRDGIRVDSRDCPLHCGRPRDCQ